MKENTKNAIAFTWLVVAIIFGMASMYVLFCFGAAMDGNYTGSATTFHVMWCVVKTLAIPAIFGVFSKRCTTRAYKLLEKFTEKIENI